MFAGRSLDDERTLGDYKLAMNSTLRLVLRPPHADAGEA